MKRTSIYYFSLAALAIGSLASCQDYDPLNEDELQSIQAQKEYEAVAKEFAQNFITRFGEPDPNHTWGFGPMTASQVTRALTRAENPANVNTNRNQWAEKDNQGYKDAAIAKHTTIPGWPNVDGYYYADDGEQRLQYITQTESHRPVGDVTEFEIQYVSAWFRTHKIERPEDYRLNLHLTDFFIQNISADNDQWEYNNLPAGTYTGNNGADVTTVTNDHHLSNVTIKQGTQHELKYNLDHLCFKPMGASATVDDTWTHVNNYNASQNNWHPEDNEYNNTKRTIMYIHSSGTEDFACHSSEGTGSDDYFYDWVLVRLTWEEEMADGQKHQREGYYLAFDCQYEKSEVKVEGDNYYSNWIVKISPASFNPEGPSKRIMCEDLGNTFDFDFNDVVFDVRYEQNMENYTAIVSLKAAGGTLPIYVGYEPTTLSGAYEAHRMLGDTSMEPINAKDGGLVRGESIYRITGLTTSDPDDIPIYVKYANGSVKSVAKAKRGNMDDYPSNDTSRPYNPDQKPFGDYTVPQKFAVPITTCWKKELKFIENSYPNFIKWVKQESGNDEWYKTIQKTDELYTWTLVPDAGQPSGSSVWDGNTFKNTYIKLTPQDETTMTSMFTDAKGGLQIAGYTGDDPIYSNLDQNVTKLVFTIVYDSNAPFSGRLVPMNSGETQFTPKSNRTFSDIPATKQAKPTRYTHSFEFSLDDLKDSDGNDCGYLVLYLTSNNVTIGDWYCTYK